MPERITFSIEIDGAPVSGELQIVSVVVKREINRIPLARVILVDGETNLSDFPVSNQDTFIPGKELVVSAGDKGEEHRIFKGVLVKHRIRVRPDGRSHLILEARDTAFQLTLNPRNALYEEVTDSDIMEEILGAYSQISPDVESMDVTHLRLVQHRSTDWDFILARARANGKLITIMDHDFKVAAPEFNQDPVVSLTFGADVTELDLEMDARFQAAGIKACSWQQADQEITEAEAQEPPAMELGNLPVTDLSAAAGDREEEIHDPGFVDESALQKWADARLLLQRMSRIIGRVRFTGNHEVQPGMTVELKGFGERFSGKAFVSGVRHELFDGGWETDIQLGLSRSLFQDTSGCIPYTELVPAIGGLHMGKVLQLQDDPDGAGRILVHLPMITPEGTGIWARQATPDAGNMRGFVWRPEIEDEVVVGFLGGDPGSAIVLGALHSGANPAPIDASDDNHEKGYVSRSEMRFHFDDDKKIITLETPGGHQLFLDEDDSSIRITELNGNTMVMNSDGITMDSPADFKVTCSGDATIEAGGNIELTASGDLTATGTNVTGEANASATVKGSASAELSSGGQTKVEGSIVMIN
ncbi:MAG: type VI secretion system tip protein VgrG [Desulfobacteraceae bacterium]|nr:type VI secretion system tip protein VgrG [Desulfobacteraceae bacterium]